MFWLLFLLFKFSTFSLIFPKFMPSTWVNIQISRIFPVNQGQHSKSPPFSLNQDQQSNFPHFPRESGSTFKFPAIFPESGSTIKFPAFFPESGSTFIFPAVFPESGLTFNVPPAYFLPQPTLMFRLLHMQIYRNPHTVPLRWSHKPFQLRVRVLFLP